LQKILKNKLETKVTLIDSNILKVNGNFVHKVKDILKKYGIEVSVVRSEQSQESKDTSE